MFDPHILSFETSFSAFLLLHLDISYQEQVRDFDRHLQSHLGSRVLLLLSKGVLFLPGSLGELQLYS
ncbi:hypothetical protein FGO68_gene7148 [Halteria grandinella]|uniref:Uncharacterized protein n=1 Tax=Halteria grandinella TaxID=5974 RepID=A0A8J8T8I5_HALGN|nr:hypothetical protein FGO68_gene7148 [Halteria grandinella]